MLYRDILRLFSTYLFALLIPLAVPLFLAIYGEWIVHTPYPPVAPAFALSMAVTAILGFLCRFLGREASGHIYRRDALLLVLFIYFLTPVLAGLPFYFSGTLKNPIDSFFEATSGITTTGASLLEPKLFDEKGTEIPVRATFHAGAEKNYSYYGTVQPLFVNGQLLVGLDAISPALIFWRSLLQWLGGGGIIVLFVAILPALGIGGKVLYQSEVTGLTKESLVPRFKGTASLLWKTYLILTFLQIVLLVIVNHKMPLFDAVTITLSTISTGGFSPHNNSIGAYNNAATEWVIILFMILGSINFSLFFFCLRGKWGRLNDSELKVFLLILLGSSLFAAFKLRGTYSFAEAVRYATFQVVSAQTSTGFFTADYDLWPFSIQVLMLIVIFIGGMAASTAGGMKVIRLKLMFRVLFNKIETIFRPDTVRTYRLGGTSVDTTTAITLLSFLLVVVSLAILGTFLLVVDGLDPETSLTTVSCMMNNGGMSFRMSGPLHSFAFLSTFGKCLSCLWMIAGRLEYFALLVILVPNFWTIRHRKWG